MSGGPGGLRGPWTADNPLPVVEVTAVPPAVEHWYPPTVDNPLPVYIVARAGAEARPAGEVILEDAPHDGRVYARRNGEWVPIGVQQD
jgi:hypothetical protein